ncbi:MAG TPA: PD-(D/E)XK nuclease family protein [Acidobacteriaceae bacterium]|nr:PD-(D/E)XK nuclease family protein [Acidobacteriaceae bacterium]
MLSSSAWTEQELVQRLQQNTSGTVLVTSTLRAARVWRARYNDTQKNSSCVAWVSPQIFAWEPWLRSLWAAAVLAGAETRLLLSPVQESHLWQQVLEQDGSAQQTLSVSALAELAQQSFRQSAQYGISLPQLRGDASPDTQAFYAWGTALLAKFRKLSCVPAAMLETALIKLVESGTVELPEEVFLVGFDRITPSQQLLIAALEKRPCSVCAVEPQNALSPDGASPIVCARTLDEEIQCAAQWIRRELLARPEQRIGVLVPSSPEMRDKIDSAFRAILAPSTMDIRAPQSALPYEFSLGTPMAHTQPVRTALTLLRWLQRPIPQKEISWLLVHGGFRSGALDSGATVDRRFREREWRLGGSISIAEFRSWLHRERRSTHEEEESGSLRRAIDALFAHSQRIAPDRPKAYGEWRDAMEEVLTDAGLPVWDTLTSQDYQLQQRWNALLNEFSSLDAVASPVRFVAALDTLDRMASKTIFALETARAPVQVLGIPESAGIVFDAVWWMSGRATDWPPEGQALPFLPWNLQRAAHMPYADPAHDALFAQSVTRTRLGATARFVVSFALQPSDPAAAGSHAIDPEIALSPLLRQALPASAIVPAQGFDPLAASETSEPRIESLETMHEEAAVPLLANRMERGVKFLEFQSACPFRAFAELRLDSRNLQETSTGLDRAAQGNLMHRVLQTFWQEIGSQDRLLQDTEAELRATLRKHIDAALRGYSSRASEAWQQTLLAIEAERMQERLLVWLQREKARSSFTVRELEHEIENAEIGGISFRCRIDRIDQTGHGDVLLDYKTGCVTANDCAGDRPDQPQLPAYAVLQNEASAESLPIAGIAFAGLHPRKTEFTVIAAQPSVFARQAEDPVARKADARSSLSPEAMHEQLADWKITLTRLAEQFRSGNAIVDPKNGSQTCNYCSQALLCRIRDAKGSMPSPEEEDSSMEDLRDQ